jgi:hypothetical protein
VKLAPAWAVPARADAAPPPPLFVRQLHTDINSFQAIEADDIDRREKPLSHAATSATALRSRKGARAGGSVDNLFSSSNYASSSTGRTEASDVSRAKLKRGSLTHSDFAAASIMLKANKRLRARLAHANCFDVIGGVSDGEMELLSACASGDRAFVVQTWIVRLMTNRLAAGGLAIPPPLLSRTYQVLSDGTAAAMQARKVSYVAFPFPLRQLLLLLLLVFNLIAPMCIAAFMDSEWLIALLSFFVCLGYHSLNETAAELEHPFGLGANHLQLTAYQRQYNSKLAHLFDQTVPSLGYIPPAPAAAASPVLRSGQPSPSPPPAVTTSPSPPKSTPASTFSPPPAEAASTAAASRPAVPTATSELVIETVISQ